ncbi:MAG: HEAT repeat domain-containing protein [Nitrospira sp.]|nr:HEAT repeat domain-containing protein [Nitrospira sp.]
MFFRSLVLFIGLFFYAILPIASADMASGVAAFQKEDYHTAYEELRPLAEADDPKAQYYIGFMHYHGKGVSRNGAEAVKWVKPAAEHGIADAQYLFALMTEAGLAGLNDKKGTRKMEATHKAEAIKWFTPAAQQGHIKAQLTLVDRYVQGEGVKRDLVEAYMWCEVAHLLAPSRCDLEQQVPSYYMTPSQKEEAKQKVRQWLVTYAAKSAPPPKNAAQQLISELDTAKSKRKEEIKSALILMGDAGSPALLRSFRSKTPRHVDFLTGVLCERGPTAASAIPELIRLYKDPVVTPSIKHHFLQSLACVGTASADAQVFLISQVKAGDDAMRPWAVMGLENFDSPDAIMALAGALSDSKRSVREAAAGVLLKLGPKAAPAIPALTKALAPKGTYLSMLASNALRAIGTPEAIAEADKSGTTNTLDMLKGGHDG